jgi:hypothetical protein
MIEMNIGKAIEVLKMENELMQFNPMTGEIEPIELQNQDNQDLYKANLIAIQALEKQIAKKPSEQLNTRIFTRKEMSEMNDIFQVDYLPDEKKVKINLPEEVWKNIDTVIMTRLFQEELVVEKQKEIELE